MDSRASMSSRKIKKVRSISSRRSKANNGGRTSIASGKRAGSRVSRTPSSGSGTINLDYEEVMEEANLQRESLLEEEFDAPVSNEDDDSRDHDTDNESNDSSSTSTGERVLKGKVFAIANGSTQIKNPSSTGPTLKRKRLNIGIFSIMQNGYENTMGGPFDKEYCPGCHTSSTCESKDGKQYPQINVKYIKMIETAIVVGFRDGKYNEACESVYHWWNDQLLPEVNRSISTPEKRRRFMPLEKWSIECIQRHILFHSNDPMVFCIRNAMKVSALGDAVALNECVKESPFMKNANNEPEDEYDTDSCMKSARLLQMGNQMMIQAIKQFIPKTNVANSVAAQIPNNPGSAATASMRTGSFSARNN